MIMKTNLVHESPCKFFFIQYEMMMVDGVPSKKTDTKMLKSHLAIQFNNQNTISVKTSQF